MSTRPIYSFFIIFVHMSTDAKSRVLRALGLHDKLKVSEIVGYTEVTWRHLDRILPSMEKEGLIKSYREGNKRIYEITSQGADFLKQQYETIISEYESIFSRREKEGRRRREEVQAIASKLSRVEVETVVRLSLAENGISPYELERRGIPDREVRPLIGKLNELGLAEKKSEAVTPAGRRIVRYVSTSVGAEIALEHLRNVRKLSDDKIRKLVKGDFDSTPLGVVYKQMQAVTVEEVPED